ncbi:class II fructose-bisphosphate aldolase [Candidatus Azambacteria bacterium]|nr:class II fructose-bisphosphate aldolase [Candidatus Azambacteria bacterium]
MYLKETKEIFKKASDSGYAIIQFNISSADQMKAVVEISKKVKAPVLFGTSDGERKFFGARQAVEMAKLYGEETGLPVILNADHAKSFEKVKEAVEAGYNSIHFDGSELEYEENIRQTKEAVDYIKSIDANISIEGELGRIGGTGASKVFTEKVVADESMYTDPLQAIDFIERTGVDRLGISVGTIHGISTAVGGEENLKMERISEIKEKLKGKCVLVLHGGSGVPSEQIKEAVKRGIVKINVNTELRVAFSGAIKKSLNECETTPYKFLDAGIKEMEKVVEDKILLSGSNGKI